MIIRRCLATSAATATATRSRPQNFSEVVKRLSKFSSRDDILEYSSRPIEYCYPNRMIAACAPDHQPPVDLIATARHLLDQLQVRVAHCICHFQTLPFLPGANPILLLLHERYLKLFETLIRFPSIETREDEEKFAETVTIFMARNNDVIGQLSAGCRETRKYFKTYAVMKQFLDDVLVTRLSMRLLGEHYLELRRQKKTNASTDDWRGIICMNFSPARLVQGCIDDVSKICFETYGAQPHVHIENNLHEPFPYFPSLVEYVMRELLKNSMRAIAEHSKTLLNKTQTLKTFFEEHQNRPLCKISITSDPIDEHFTIAVSDLGGGISDSNEKIFEYMFTGDAVKADAAKEEENNEQTDILADFQDRMILSSKQMFGYGFGLPVCLLYTRFLCGSLTVRQISHIGADVYLRLGFIHTDSERIKI